MCQFLLDLEKRFNCELRYLDIGGGFASRNALQGVYLPPEQVVPGFDQYAEVIGSTIRSELAERTAAGRALPELVLESGRAVIDDAQVLLTSVVGNKTLPDGRRGVVLDAGVNLLFTAFWYHHKVQLTSEPRGYPEESVLYGPLCMNIDVIRQSIALPPLRVDDTLLISPVGAYNNTQWLQFIEYRPAIVLLHESDSAVSIIRAAENLDTMISQEQMPHHLADCALEDGTDEPAAA
jgi:diaminopimelate decarboxylase